MASHDGAALLRGTEEDTSRRTLSQQEQLPPLTLSRDANGRLRIDEFDDKDKRPFTMGFIYDFEPTEPFSTIDYVQNSLMPAVQSSLRRWIRVWVFPEQALWNMHAHAVYACMVHGASFLRVTHRVCIRCSAELRNQSNVITFGSFPRLHSIPASSAPRILM